MSKKSNNENAYAILEAGETYQLQATDGCLLK